MAKGYNLPDNTGPNDPDAPWNEPNAYEREEEEQEACLNCYYFNILRDYCVLAGEFIDYPYQKNCDDWKSNN